MPDKQEKLDKLREELLNRQDLRLAAYRQEHDYQMVFGEGDANAAIMFIGEAPGEQEAKSGRPFVGRSGSVLEELLASIGLARGDVYITNVIKDRPPGNRDPHREEIESYRPFLRQQMAIIRPAVIATLGRFAMEFIFEEFDVNAPQGKISELHGQQLSATGPIGEVTFVPLYHPAVALYDQAQREVLRQDFETLSQYV